MNIKNLKKLIEHLETEEDIGFNMSNWFTHRDQIEVCSYEVLPVVENHVCGTVACVAGHAAILAWKEGEYLRDIISSTAMTWLDLKEQEADELFYGPWKTQKNLSKGTTHLTKEDAIKELKYLVTLEGDF